jgi:hypothetical protein
MLQHGLQGFEQKTLILPRRFDERPDCGFLEDASTSSSAQAEGVHRVEARIHAARQHEGAHVHQE